jgi:hypothetical protein
MPSGSASHAFSEVEVLFVAPRKTRDSLRQSSGQAFAALRMTQRRGRNLECGPSPAASKEEASASPCQGEAIWISERSASRALSEVEVSCTEKDPGSLGCARDDTKKRSRKCKCSISNIMVMQRSPVRERYWERYCKTPRLVRVQRVKCSVVRVGRKPFWVR